MTHSLGFVLLRLDSTAIFLGSSIKPDGSCEGEIKRRLALGRTAMQSLTKIWKSRDVNTSTKRRLVETLVFSIVKYGSESWTLSAKDRKRIDSFELWCWRRALRISWTNRTTNQAVLMRIGNPIPLEAAILKQRLGFLGQADGLEKRMMVAMIEGNRRRGRPRTQWVNSLTRDARKGLKELMMLATYEGVWRKQTHVITRSRKRLDGTG